MTSEEERLVLDFVAERRGHEHVEENRELILARATLIGDLDDESDRP